jgi:hypothetical protein
MILDPFSTLRNDITNNFDIDVIFCVMSCLK